MITRELLDYVKEQLSAGHSQDQIRQTLLTNKWHPEDVEMVLRAAAVETASAGQNAAPSQNPVTEDVQNKKAPVKTSAGSSNKIIYILIAIVGLFIVAAGALAVAVYLKNNTDIAQPRSATLSVQPAVLPKTQSVSRTSELMPDLLATGSAVFRDQSKEYSFRYPVSWKLDGQGSLTVLSLPENPNSQKCKADLADVLSCDVAFSTVNYSTASAGMTVAATPSAQPKTHADQTLYLARQMNNGIQPNPITINGLPGYEATTSTSSGSTYNIVLQGQKQIILVQFLFKKSRSDLTPLELAVLNSVNEL